jgi:predicted transposase/invertase (TIGR01784 family)
MDKNISYDGIFKEFMETFDDSVVVEFINELFDRKHSHNSKVARLATESHDDSKERRSDIVLRIGRDMYHVEIQSGNDNEIALRVFEYSYRAAMQHGKSQDENSLELEFPKSLVFYLRSNDKTPRELAVSLKLPDDNIVKFTIPTKRLGEYQPHDLTKNSLIALAPFYPMLFEGKNLKDPAELKRLEETVLFFKDEIASGVKDGKISRRVADLALKSLDDILKNVLVKSKLDRKEVDEIMENVMRKYHCEPLNWREEGRIEGLRKGKAEGKAEGKVETAKNLFAMGLSFEDIQRATGLKVETLERLQTAVAAEQSKNLEEIAPPRRRR